MNKILIQNFHPKDFIKNSIQLLDSLNKIKINHCYRLFSLDVKNPFPSIPITDLKNINFIDKNFSETQKLGLLKLIDLCLEQNYYVFNQIFYKQNDGLPMGSPLSPLLAEIYRRRDLESSERFL